jgi:hypothetical protein
MAAVEGFEYSASGLTISFGEGLIDGRAVAAGSPADVTPATADFRGFLVSEDGDGTWTVTQTADDSHASAALAAAAALELAIPAGGVALVTGAVNNTTTLSEISIARRGEVPEDTASADE